MPIADWYKLRDRFPWPIGPYVGAYDRDDPREVLNKRRQSPGPDGWVMVKASEIKDVYEMRVCRSTQDFDRDEDGPTQKMTAHCVKEAGHRGLHGNGYYTWQDGREVPSD